VQAGFPHECNTCHTINAWRPSNFDHTFFPLTGGHAGRTCSQCHANGVYHGTSPLCYSCHQADYEGTTDPNHAQAGFPHECNTCHTINGWGGANFDHSFFPLTGGHAGRTCSQCHANGIYHGTSALCYSCHRADYEGTTDPNHVQAGFPHECNTCHTINGWDGANFNHSFYPLTGGHAGRTCNQCHGNGVYHGTSTVCYSCHQADYQGTTDPNHTAAHFPTDCALCHTITVWGNGRFDHDGLYFPIYSGNHNRVWQTCADCHTSPTDFRVFSCILCHEHSNRSEVDGDHQGVAGYRYASDACYSCHPQGRH
jgi:hypothetical protein